MQFIALAGARAIHMVACAAVGAMLLFRCMTRRREGKRVGGNGGGGKRRLGGIAVTLALLIVLASGIAWFVLVAADMSGLPLAQAIRPAVLRVVWTRTHFGKLWQWRTGIFAALLVLLRFSRRTTTQMSSRRALSQPRLRSSMSFLSLTLSMALLGSLAWAGHGSTGRLPTLHLIADALHLLATAIWPGGLLVIVAAWRESRVHLTESSCVDLPLNSSVNSGPHPWLLIRRLSTLALWTVLLLTLTGAINACCLLPSWNALVDTYYGQLLLLKIGLFGMMIALGAANRWLFMPRLEADHLRRAIAAEMVLGIAIFAIVGVLGLLPPTK